jgi:hypothetical protein
MTDQKIEILFASIEKMNKRLGSIEAMMKSTTKKISEIEDSFQSDSDDSAWEGFGPKPEKTPVNPNAEQYTLELHHGPYTIYRHDGESDKEWQRRKDHLMDQRITFLNGSGQNGTPEQVAYLQRIEERLGRKVFQYPLATT